MPARSFFWTRSKKRYEVHNQWIDGLWTVLLLVAAVLLFTVDLGKLPLRNWDEVAVAQVAQEMWRAPINSLTWLYPTLGGESYQNHPPLTHWLIAITYKVGGVNAWTTRLPGAILSALSIPLLYTVARELFYQRIRAVYSALVYLTMLPVVSHGRLATWDGGVVFFSLVMILYLLRSRRNLVYCLGVGVSLGLICLTQGMIGLLLGAIAVIFLLWDTPRLLTSYYFWIAIALGMLPVALWYGGQTFITTGAIGQSLNPIWKSLENSDRSSWLNILEILKYTLPWLLFLPQALRLCWQNKNLSWAKLILVWMGAYLLIISTINIKLPFSTPIYPSIALAIGAFCGEIEDFPLLSSYPRFWVGGLTLLAIAACSVNIYYSYYPVTNTQQTELQLILTAVTITMALSAILAHQGDRQFLKVLVWGSYLSLMLFVQSHQWIGQLGEQHPVKPIETIIHTPNPENRYFLNSYSDRSIL